MKATDYHSGQRVTYIGRTQDSRGNPYFGKSATVIRPIKSRNVVHIRWEGMGPDYPTFDAKPHCLKAEG